MEQIKGLENIKREVLENTDYLRVLRTSPTMQVTTMCVPYGGEIPRETHSGGTQMTYIMAGVATVISSSPRVGGVGFPGDIIWVPPDTDHWIISGTGREVTGPDGTASFALWPSESGASPHPALKVMSVYAPPEHAYDETIVEYPAENRRFPEVAETPREKRRRGGMVQLWM